MLFFSATAIAGSVAVQTSSTATAETLARAPFQISFARPNQITVTTPSATVLITRDPFRMQFLGARGRLALAESDPAGVAGTALVAPTVDPLPPGTDSQATATLYRPLCFLVGSETLVQYNGGVWGGNPMSGTREGIEYCATNVTSAGATAGALTLTLATSDPSGRTLKVVLGAPSSSTVSVAASAQPAAGVAQLGDSFASSADEGFFGFGGRHDGLDQRGQQFSSFVEEENIDGVPGQSASPAAALFPNGPLAAYYPQAEFISSHPYGFLLTQSELARFKLDHDRGDAWNVTASAPSLDYVVAVGDSRRAIRELTALSGRQPAAPQWALGPMLDRLVKNVGESQSDYQGAVADDLARIRSYRLPLTAYRLEGWGYPGDGSNDGFSLHTQIGAAAQGVTIRALRKLGIHTLLYMRPWISPGSAPERQGLVATQADGSPYETTGTTGQQFSLLDFSKPAAVRWWQHEVDRALDLGADGFMQDFGEEVLYDMHFADGETGVTMHNRYLTLYARATRQAFNSYMQSHRKRTLFYFTRAGYSGTPGSAAFEGGNFPGDETTDWSQVSGLQSLTSDMLNRGIGGAYGFATDIGGYYDYTTPATTKELFLRWAEWAVFSPVFRLHGSGRSGTHTPWSYDAQTVSVYNSLSRLHLRAAPLIERLWRAADRTGIPPTRPLWLEFPGDVYARTQDQEWMLGDDVLVAPVVQQGAGSRSVYLPRGCWKGWRRRYRGPATITVSAGLTVLPWFTRCGSKPF